MSQVQQLITEHLDIWTAADISKKSGRGRASSNAGSVYGVKKLRELILELAVRGKLVPQNVNDEPAIELLKTIRAEKAKLVAQGKIKKDKPLAVMAEEGPFELPKKWLWVRIGDVCSYIQRGKGPDYVEISDFSVISQKCVRWTGLDLTQARFIDPNSLSKYEPIRLLRKGDILWNSTGTGTIGRACLVPQFQNEQFLVADSHVTVVRPIGFLDVYLWRWIQSPSVQSEIEGVASGTTNQIELNTSTVISYPLPLPPLEEQHRIVAKVDELMALCDQLETQYSNAADAHEQLVRHLLGTLTQSQDSADFNTNWRRIAAHFDTLFTTESSIDALKQALLQLAVTGKLAPQDKNDEPANILLKKIKNEKAQLLGQKIYQKTGTLKSKERSEKYPQHWEHVQTGELCPSIVPSRDKPRSFSGDIPWITLPAFPVNEWYLDTDSIDLRLSAEEAITYSARVIPENSVLMSCIGRFGLTAINKIPVIPNQQIHAFIVLDGLVPEYLSIAIRVAGKQMEEMATSTTIAYLNKSNCESIEFGLPPLPEQHRIVAKVDELMSFCEQLKFRISEANLCQQKLADMLVVSATL